MNTSVIQIREQLFEFLPYELICRLCCTITPSAVEDDNLIPWGRRLALPLYRHWQWPCA